MTDYDPELTQAAFLSLHRNATLIYGAMKACKIPQYDPDYEDYLAEAELHYIEIYCKKRFDRLQTKYRPQQCLNYLFGAVYWHLRHMQRAKYRELARRQFLEVSDHLNQASLPEYENKIHDHQHQIIESLLLAELLEQMTPEEQRFLWLRWVERRPMHELQKIFNCSNRKLFYLQGRIQKMIDAVKNHD